jgi:hypothetical protein
MMMLKFKPKLHKSEGDYFVLTNYLSLKQNIRLQQVIVK